MNVANLFATPIALFDGVSPTPDLIATLAEQALANVDDLPDWDCNIQTTFAIDNTFHTKSQLAQFTPDIELFASDYSKYLWGRSAKIRHCWVNKADSHQYQEYHNHLGKNIDFCGVYYPQIQDKETIIFHSPFQNISSINQNSIVQIGLKQNRLILFPSYLAHSFKAKQREIAKISVAFNFQLV